MTSDSGLISQDSDYASHIQEILNERARSHFSDQAASKARCEVAIRFNMFHRPAL
jgi:hypothetical protein